LGDKLEYERSAMEKGYSVVVGIDEAGRGPLAGPVVAAACHLGEQVKITGIDDSKKLTKVKRERIFQELTEDPYVSYGVGIMGPEVIDKVNIFQATILAMKQAVENHPLTPDYLLVDGLQLPSEIPSKKIVKGDTLSLFIAAASILAKVTRDRLMLEYDQKWPMYGFKRNMGYGTREHLEALKEYGPSPIHRESFKPKALFACHN